MSSMVMWALAISMVVFPGVVFAQPNISGSGSLQQVSAATYTSIRLNSTCEELSAWLPPRVNPAIVLQAVTIDYADVERNFIALMEANSQLSRDYLYLMCLDTQSVEEFRVMGINCVMVEDMNYISLSEIWRLRVKVLGCLLTEGYDVLLSDSDALWLDDPMKDLGSPSNNDSSIVASRGSFPSDLGRKWGSTMCMGFVLFRASGFGMRVWQEVMLRIIGETGDDQVALNKAADELGIIWATASDMQYEQSTSAGRGVVAALTTANGDDFSVTLLPHSRYTRICSRTPISNATVVAHCLSGKNGRAKTAWMKGSNLWHVNNSDGG